MKKVELLAPAKDKETAIAAINCGADAVYIGAENFGARRAVPNSLEDIKDVVDYAHKFYARVHVTINTILTDEELVRAKELIKKLYEIGVDAIIVQDSGILELAIEGKLPPIPLHMSTQCDNRTLEKAMFFDKIGVSRIILARELSIPEIKKICENVSCEVETFIHGALCVSYSGQCYLSYSIGGRSANRGECAQPCRKKYSLVDDKGNFIAKDKYLLSLKDFNASKHLESLINAGVKSFKIEGRLKDINYVKNVVAFYGKEIEKFAEKTSSGKVFLDFEPNLYKTFNRGFTDYFLDGRKKCFNFESPKSMGEKLGRVENTGKDFFELNAEISPQDGLCWIENGIQEGCLVNRVEGRRIFPNKKVNLKKGTMVFRNQDVEFEKLLKNSKTKRRIGVNVVYENGMLFVTDEDGNSVSLEFVNTDSPKNPEKMKETFISQFQKTGESDFYVSSVKIDGELPFMPVSRINEIRRNILGRLMDERLKNYPKEIQNPLTYTDFPQHELDYRTNIHNSQAKCFYEHCSSKVCENSLESSNNFNGKYLMQTKHCLKYAFDLCKSSKKLFLIDEKGKKYPLKFDCKNCMMMVCHD